jgi:hypothetical protein
MCGHLSFGQHQFASISQQQHEEQHCTEHESDQEACGSIGHHQVCQNVRRVYHEMASLQLTTLSEWECPAVFRYSLFGYLNFSIIEMPDSLQKLYIDLRCEINLKDLSFFAREWRWGKQFYRKRFQFNSELGIARSTTDAASQDRVNRKLHQILLDNCHIRLPAGCHVLPSTDPLANTFSS